MTKYEKIILTYYNPVLDGKQFLIKEFKNATFMFDGNYTSIVTKRNNFTIKTDSVFSINCEEEVE